VPSATPIPPTATPDLRVGGFIVLDGKIYAAADDGALVGQDLPDNLRVAKLSFSAENTLLALDESGAEVARFENGVWIENAKFYSKDEIGELAATEAGKAELLAAAPEYDGLVKSHVHNNYVAYKNEAGEFVSFYDLTGEQTKLVDAETAGFWTIKDWQEFLDDGKVQMAKNTWIEKSRIFTKAENVIYTSPDQIEDLPDNTAYLVLKSDQTAQWIGSKPDVQQMLAEGGMAIVQTDDEASTAMARIVLLAMNERYLNEKAQNPNFKPDKPWFVIGENGLINIGSSGVSPFMHMIIERDENGRLVTPVMSSPPGLVAKFGIEGNMIDIPNVKNNPYWIEEIKKKAEEEGVVIDLANLQPNQLFLFFAAVAQ
jgi:hypothetical protein